MSTSHANLAAPLAPVGSRAARRALRAEKAQLLRWRRLLRARLDLTVAGFAPPEPLGTIAWEVLPDGRDRLPLPSELAAAIAVVTPIDPVELLTRLRRFDRALEAYADELDDALDDSTQDVVRTLALTQGATVTPLPTRDADGGR